MSPKKITRLGLIVATVSVVGMIVMALVGPEWGWLNGWPAIGFGLAVLLLIVSFLRGAYLTAQRRVEMVDKLNDCYTGVPASSDEAMGSETKRR
ncbi:MAG TPA: hypothetical protein VEC93_01105, partial [Anaerolineae bacterium]|nr:hypothetical protein [Anaerolineae bacterium]